MKQRRYSIFATATERLHEPVSLTPSFRKGFAGRPASENPFKGFRSQAGLGERSRETLKRVRMTRIGPSNPFLKEGVNETTNVNKIWGRAAILMVLAFAAAVGFLFTASAKTPPAKAPVPAAPKAALADLKIFPADINLSSKQDKQSLVVQATYADGATRDVTSEASFSLKDKTIARLEKEIVSPLADGKTELAVQF